MIEASVNFRIVAGSEITTHFTGWMLLADGAYAAISMSCSRYFCATSFSFQIRTDLRLFRYVDRRSGFIPVLYAELSAGVTNAGVSVDNAA